MFLASQTMCRQGPDKVLRRSKDGTNRVPGKVQRQGGPAEGTNKVSRQSSDRYLHNFFVVENHQIQPIDSIYLDRGPNSINICLSVYLNLVLVLVVVGVAESHHHNICFCGRKSPNSTNRLHIFGQGPKFNKYVSLCVPKFGFSFSFCWGCGIPSVSCCDCFCCSCLGIP